MKSYFKLLDNYITEYNKQDQNIFLFLSELFKHNKFSEKNFGLVYRTKLFPTSHIIYF